MFIIFDLDHTVVCSRHRQATLPCGSLNLAHWVENNTPEKIMRDSLLPLAAQWRKIAKKRSAEIVVCTARVMTAPDFEFLAKNRLIADYILHRQDGDRSPDYLLKERLLTSLAARKGYSLSMLAKRSIMFDDNQSVISHLSGLGFTVHDAVKVNRQLAGLSL
jgi:hypothetical protein